MATSAREDLGRVALGAPALKEVFIVSIPDCLLIKSWARAGRTNEEETAVQLGSVFRASVTALTTAVGSEAVEGVTVEARDTLIRLEQVTPGMMAAFVFERSAPLGLMRVQARQLRDHIRGSVEQFTKPMDTGAVQRIPPSSADRAAPPRFSSPSTEERAVPRFGPTVSDPQGETPPLGVPRVRRPTQPAPTPVFESPPTPVFESPPPPVFESPPPRVPPPPSTTFDSKRAADAFTREVTPFVAEATMAPDPTPLPGDLTITPTPMESPSSEAEITGRFDRTEFDDALNPPTGGATAPRPASPASELETSGGASEAPRPLGSPAPSPIPDVPTRPVARPRATRLLDFFRRYAPDPHAALLRLSLRTGIPVDLLEAPDALDDAQVDAIADSIRDILGQDTVGI